MSLELLVFVDVADSDFSVDSLKQQIGKAAATSWPS